MRAWINHLYMQRMREEFTLGREFSYDPALTALQIDGKPFDLRNPAFLKFCEIIRLDPFRDEVYVSAVPYKLQAWTVQHRSGPGSYDSSKIDAFFDFLRSGNNSTEMDRLWRHGSGKTISEIQHSTHIVLDPDDEGVNGDVCFSLDLSKSGGVRGFSVVEANLAMASTFARILPMSLKMVQNQLNSFSGLELAEGFSQTRAPNSAYLIDDGYPDKITIKRNGEDFFSIEVGARTKGKPLSLKWLEAKFEGSHSTLQTVLSMMPESQAKKLKAMRLESDLGM